MHFRILKLIVSSGFLRVLDCTKRGTEKGKGGGRKGRGGERRNVETHSLRQFLPTPLESQLGTIA